MLFNWLALGVGAAAAVFSCLMLAFEVLPIAPGVPGLTGANMLVPEGMGGNWGWVLTMLTAIAVFLPLLLALLSLLNCLRKRKKGKIKLGVFYAIAAVIIWVFPYMFAFLDVSFAEGFGSVSFDIGQMLNPGNFTWIVWAAALTSVAAAAVHIVAGVLMPKKK